jgi:hypothetical protein
MGILDRFFRVDIQELRRLRDREGLLKALKARRLDDKWGALLALYELEAHGSRTENLATVLIMQPNSTQILGDLLALDDDWRTETVLSLLNWQLSMGGVSPVQLGDKSVNRADLVRPEIAKLEDAIIHCLANHRSRSVRSSAANVLGELRDPRALEPLIRALRDEYSQVRNNAVEALGKLGGGPRAVEPLINALEETWSENRSEAAYGTNRQKIGLLLASLDDPRAAQVLATAVRRGFNELFDVARGPFKKWGAAAVAAQGILIEALQAERGDVQVYAAEFLGYVGDSAAAVALDAARRTSKKGWGNKVVSQVAEEALERIGDRQRDLTLTATRG